MNELVGNEEHEEDDEDGGKDGENEKGQGQTTASARVRWSRRRYRSLRLIHLRVYFTRNVPIRQKN
jgi:hypothetical protein